MKRNRLVSLIKTPIFVAKEYLHRRPDPKFNWSFGDAALRERARPAAETLQRDGIVLLPAHFQGAQLQRLRDAFERTVAGRPSKYDPDSFLNLEFLEDDPAFIEAAVDDLLLQIVADYYGKKFSIGRASAMRLLPSDPGRYNSYQWHHDARGRQVHLMILLTDMPADGQRMTYLRGSHLTYYDHYRGLAEGSRFEEDIAHRPDLQEKIAGVTGPAGTVALFDANGLHSGNRNLSVTRDTLTYCYVTYRHFKKIRCRKAHLTALPPAKRDVLTFNPFCEQVD